ncbi:hypothetical protein PCCS19_30030 [Paenibacillus sp. CCS19]|uniref:non-ribosomal peptide synthetase n=1 Tax=Paenibacillus sp. CCS19 TaxID=3158387 RepID=UPI002564BD50|nr:non-ribosomal peptide synthetase [Paenibacillus cellulosilyticus]GMK39948.1 hypothetical protein PCCS19_30030 [Paenibacillus cellulosilyticus]
MVDSRNTNDDYPVPNAKQALLARLKEMKTRAAVATLDHNGQTIQSSPLAAKPLSYNQRSMWFQEQLNPGLPSYYVPLAIRLEGALDSEALERALLEVMNRHEILRSRYAVVNGIPHQLVDDDFSFRLLPIEIPPGSERESNLASTLRKEACRPFHLEEGNLVRGLLVRLGEKEHVLFLTMHHMVTDGWSVGVLLSEMKALYEAELAGRPAQLAPLHIQYGDYAVWQNETANSEAMKGKLAYWKERLQGAPKLLDYPLDYARPRAASGAGKSIAFQLPEQKVKALTQIAQQENATLFMALLACYHMLLSKLVRGNDIVIGIPSANRELVETEPLIGNFVHTLPVRIDSEGLHSFGDMLQHVRHATTQSYQHQDVPLELIVDAMGVARDISYTPLFQTLFAFNNTPISALAFGGLVASHLHVDTNTAKYDVSMDLWPTAEGLSGRLDYSTDLFRDETAQLMLNYWLRIVDAVIQSPALQLQQLSLTTEDEKKQLLEMAAPSRVNRDADLYGLHRRFEEQVERTPDAAALFCGGASWTYGQLNERANLLAWQLRKEGVTAGTLVGLYMARTMDTVASIIGVLKAGGAYVPIDPNSPKDRISYILEDAGLSVIVTTSRLAANLSDLPCTLVDMDNLDYEADKSNLEIAVDPEQLAYIIYTSGSTGKPKGIEIEHRNVARLFTSTETFYRFGRDDVWTLFHSFAFDFSVWEMWGGLLYGGKVVVVTYEESRNPEAFYRLLIEAKVTVLNQTPTAFRQLLAAEQEALNRGIPLVQSLRWIIFGGESLEFHILKPWFERHGEGRTALVNMYGITETTVHVTIQPINASDVDERNSLIGQPIEDLQLYLLDENRNPCPIGIPGELYIGGAGLARGYFNRPELTKERFIANPFAAGGRLYRTGDLARRLPDGNVAYIGRVDHQVKIRGFRIELGEIDYQLSLHPHVRDCASVIHEDEGGNKRISALVVPEGEHRLTISELGIFLRRSLPDYMVPQLFVFVDSIPMNHNGKIDVTVLNTYTYDRGDMGISWEPPSTEAESLLHEVWIEVLAGTEIGVNDNFFMLGGDSIRAIQVVALSKQRGLNFTLQQVFLHQTIRELAEVSSQQTTADDVCPRTQRFHRIAEEDRLRMPEDVEDAYPLTQLQLGMIYHLEYSDDSTSYFNTTGFKIRGELKREALQQAVDEVVRRHAVLRTTFDFTSYREPLQLVYREASLMLEFEDISALGAAQQEARLAAWNKEEMRRRFDLKQAPLLRIMVHALSKETFQFTITECHAILDGWSLTSIMREIFDVYLHSLNGGAALPYEQPSLSFRDYVWLERELMETPRLENYWKLRMLDYKPTTVPLWDPKQDLPAEDRSFQRRLQFFSHELQRGIQSLSGELNVPIKYILLAAHFKVLSVLNGQSDVVTGVVANGRPEGEDGDRVRGLFLNTLPYRVDVGNRTWQELIQAVFAADVEMMPNRRYPLFAIQKALGGEELFDTSFNFVHFHELRQIERSGQLEFLDLTEVADTNFLLQAAFSIVPMTGGILLMLDSDGSRITSEQSDAIAGYYMRTLEAMVRNPAQPHHAFSVLSERERAEVLGEWSEGPRVMAAEPQLIHRSFTAQAKRTPEAAAIVDEQVAMTYRELDRRSDVLASILAAKGIGPEMRVGLCADRSARLIVGMLGILKAGGAYVPLDPAYPQERLAFMLADSSASALVTERGHEQRFANYRGDIVLLDELEAAADADANADTNTDTDTDTGVIQPASAEPHHLAYVMYTSGSTGQPKGVMIEHRNVMNYVDWAAAHYRGTEGTGAPVHSSLAFDLTVTSVLVPLLSGTTVRLLPEGKRLAAEELADTLRGKADYTLVKLTPAHLGALGHLLSEADGAESARTLVIGGEQLLGEQLRYWRNHAPNIRLINEYGPTETTVGCCIYEVQPQDPSTGAVPIGRPIANTRLYILDERMQPVPVGVQGELYIGGAGVARGYLNRPELTEQRFVPDPFDAEGGRLYKTGDLARYRMDGVIEYLGRMDDQVKIKGYRIELGEVEAALVRCPGIREGAAAVRTGQSGDKLLAAYLVQDDEAKSGTNAAAVREWLKERLPEHMVPTAYRFMNKLPLTINGKVDRASLPDPEVPEREVIEAASEAPRTEMEEKLAAIWSEVLGVPHIGLHDNFFELGGDSIMAFRVVSIGNARGIQLKPKQLFEWQTVSRLAKVASYINGVTPANDDKVTGELKATPIIRWFYDQNIPNRYHYNQSMFIQVPGHIGEAQHREILQALIRHHDALRIRMDVLNDSPVLRQAEVNEEQDPLVWIDVTHTEEKDMQQLIESTCERLQRSLNLANGPIMRAGLFFRGVDQSAYLLLVVHHLAVDGLSWRILLEDWQTAHSQLQQRNSIQLPNKTASFQRWADMQHEAAQTEQVKKEAAFWKSQVSDDSAAIPVDWPEGDNLEQYSGRITIELGEEETRNLLSDANKAYRTQINDLLLSALVSSMEPWTLRPTLSIDLEGHGREEIGTTSIDVTRTVGWFTSMYPVLLDKSGKSGPGETLVAVKEQLRRIPNKGVAYGMLRYLTTDPAISEALASLAQRSVRFNYLGQYQSPDEEQSDNGLAPYRSGAMVDPGSVSSHLLGIDGWVVSGKLHLSWTFSERKFRKETIQKAADRYLEELRKLIAHCLEVKEPAFTPSDFPNARISADDLKSILNKYSLKQGGA